MIVLQDSEFNDGTRVDSQWKVLLKSSNKYKQNGHNSGGKGKKIEISGSIFHYLSGSVKTPSQGSELSSQSPSVSASLTRSLSNSFIEMCIDSDVW